MNKICGENKGQHGKNYVVLYMLKYLFFFVLWPNFNNPEYIFRICYPVYVDFGEGKDTLVLSVDTNGAEKVLRMWNMEIKQIPCESSLLGEL